ncbi:hypothetical protein K4E_11520 [Enterococcus thailandicus]|nr:hypothetical protein K4E_11520 [Enterococcus thailandicus]
MVKKNLFSYNGFGGGDLSAFLKMLAQFFIIKYYKSVLRFCAVSLDVNNQMKIMLMIQQERSDLEYVQITSKVFNY